jgi:hypothetical protein
VCIFLSNFWAFPQQIGIRALVFDQVQKIRSARISVWRIPLCSSRKYDSNAPDRVSIGALTNSLAPVKVWSNLENFPEIFCKFLNEEDDHVSATSSPSHRHISATSALSQHPVSATSSPHQRHVIAQSAPSQRHVSDQSAPSQRHVIATSAPRQRSVSATSAQVSIPQSENIPSIKNIPSENIPLS